MSERVTRAQAEAAMDRVASWIPRAWDGGDFHVAAPEDIATVNALRAYLAQRPDEDTIRKGNEHLHLMSSWARGLAEWEAVRRRVTEDEEAIKAAMYQPEED